MEITCEACGDIFQRPPSHLKQRLVCSQECWSALCKVRTIMRFWKQVEITESCWLWRGLVATTGYGKLNIKHSSRRKAQGLAHRMAYERIKGPIPDGLQLDHLCRNRLCVNPDHLEPVTGGVNVLRGMAPSAINARKTHCVNGHPLSGDSLKITPEGYRRCAECTRQNALAAYYRKKGVVDAIPA